MYFLKEIIKMGKRLFVVYHELNTSKPIKTRSYFRASSFDTLIRYLNETHFQGFGIITQIKRLKRIYRKTDYITEV